MYFRPTNGKYPYVWEICRDKVGDDLSKEALQNAPSRLLSRSPSLTSIDELSGLHGEIAELDFGLHPSTPKSSRRIQHKQVTTLRSVPLLPGNSPRSSSASTESEPEPEFRNGSGVSDTSSKGSSSAASFTLDEENFPPVKYSSASTSPRTGSVERKPERPQSIQTRGSASRRMKRPQPSFKECLSKSQATSSISTSFQSTLDSLPPKIANLSGRASAATSLTPRCMSGTSSTDLNCCSGSREKSYEMKDGFPLSPGSDHNDALFPQSPPSPAAGSVRPDGTLSSNFSPLLTYTREHTNGLKFAKLGGKRMDVTIVREAVSQAVSQGKISKSVRREIRQLMLRGELNAILQTLRRECHLKPVVSSLRIPPSEEFNPTVSQSLLKHIDHCAPLQSSDLLARKHRAIADIERVIDEWLKGVAVKNGKMDRDDLFSIFVGGSWHLKVDTAESDIDIVCLVPIWVTRNDFFNGLREILARRKDTGNILIMEGAQVPRMRLKYNRIDVDLLLAVFTQMGVPKSLPLHSDQILAGMDAGSVKSISGPRVSSLLLELVPDPSTFRTVLRCIRHWAQRRGLYSNKLGFLGGVSWSVLVAFICQLFPAGSPASLLRYFFVILSQWKWPAPILLSKPYDAGLGCAQWCPKDHAHERAHVMPIITPGYPAANSAVNVTPSTLRVIHDEFTRGREIMDDLIRYHKYNISSCWQKLFSRSDFASRYSHYLCIDLIASNDQDLTSWGSFVESRIRKLVESLQYTPSITYVHPFSIPFDQTSSGKNGMSYFVGFEVEGLQGQQFVAHKTVEPVIVYFLATEIEGCAYQKAGMKAAIAYRRREELPEFVVRSKKAGSPSRLGRMSTSRSRRTSRDSTHEEYAPRHRNPRGNFVRRPG